MSKVIDERVVSMQFDNKHFESNVRTTMSTLDKLKAKLNFTGSAKGLENINSAATKCNLSPLSNAVDSVGIKFNGLYTIADQALRNITNSAMSAGKKIISALTIDPVKTGFSEYETQINATQTILANTESKGTGLDEVNAALEELNKYADKTIYNFTEMTRNIGTFTAAGVDLQTSVDAIQGIANLAAVSGSTSQQASTAMYQLSQALAAGRVSLMDWNSVVNAGMGGEMFQNALRETSRELGTGADEAIELYGSFRESLSRGQWLTTDVLTETLKKFTTKGAAENIAEYTGLTKEMVQATIDAAEAQYDEEEAIEQAAKALAEKSGKNYDEILSSLKFAKNAENAATKVKTLTQLWDVMKESAQSGWAQTWKIIVGDFKAAKELFTPLADFFTGVIGKMSDARNNLLQGALDLATPWKSITDKLNGAGLGNIKKVADSIVDMTDKVTHFQDVVNDVWRGDFKTSDTGRFELLEAAGYDHRVVQDLVNLGANYKVTVEDIEASHKKFGLTLETNAEQTENVADALSNLSDEKLREAGLTEAEIKLYRDLEAEAERTGKTISQLAEEMSKADGRSLLIDSLKNAGKGIVEIFTAMGKAWRDIFPPMSVVQLYNIIKGINEFSKKLVVSEGTAEKLTRVFKGLFAVIDIIGTVIGGGFKLAFKAVSGVLGLFNLDILDAAAYIGDMLVNVRDWIDEHSLLNKVLDKFGPKIKEAVSGIQAWADKTKPIATLLENLGSFFDKTSSYIMDWVGGLTSTDDIFGYLLDSLKELPGKIFSGLKNLGSTLGKYLGNIFERPISVISEFKDKVLDKLEPVGDGINGFVQKVKNFVKELDIGFGEIVTILVGGGMIFALIKFASTFGKVVGILTNISDAFAGIGESISGAFNKIGNAARIIGLAVAIAILAKAFIELAKLDWKQFAVGVASLASIAVILGGLTFALSLMEKKEIAIVSGTAALLGIAVAIGILAGALHLVSKIESDSILEDILILGGIGVALVGVTALLSKLAPEISKGSITMIAIAGAILLLVYAVSKIEALSISDPKKLITTLGGLILGLAVVSKLADGVKLSSAFGIIVMVGAILLFAHAIEHLAGINTSKIKANIDDIALIIGMLAVVLLASRIAGGNAAKAGVALLSISAALTLVGVAIKVLASISPSDMAYGTKVITQILAMFALLTVVSSLAGNNAAKAGLMLMEMSAALLIISGSIFILSKIAQNNEAGLEKAADVIYQMIFMFGVIIVASHWAQKAMGTLIVIGVVLGLLTVALGALSMIPDSDLKSATTSLVLVMGAFAGLLAVTKLINTGTGAFLKTSGTLIIMAGVVAVLGTVIAKLASLNPGSALEAAESLSLLLISLSASLGLLALAGMAGWGALIGIGSLVVLIAAVGGVMAAINGIVGDAEKAEAGLDTAIMVLEKIGTGIGSFIGGIFGGIGAGVFSGLQSMAEDLNAFMGELTKEGGFIEGAKTVDESAINGVKNIIELLAMFAGVEFLDTMLSSPFEMLIGLFKKDDSSEVSALVTKLTEFGNALKAFSEATSGLDETDINRILILADASKALVTVADSIPNEGGLAGLIAGNNDLGAFAKKLSKFGEGLVDFGESVRDLTPEDIEKIKTSADAAMALAAMADSIPNMGGILAEFFGENDLSTFGGKLELFGGSLVAYGTSIRELTKEDVEKIKTSADAGMALAEMADAVPNIGGRLAEFFGENDLTTFGEKLELFGRSLVAYGTSIRELTDEDIENIARSANAAKALAEMADAVPNMGGKMAVFFGENDLTVFGTQISGFGDCLMNYARSVLGISDEHIDAIDRSKEAVKALAGVAKAVPNEGGLWQAVAGENNVLGFSKGMRDLAQCILDYVKMVANIDDDTVDAIKNSKDAVEELAEIAEKTPKMDKDQDLSGFAKSMPSVGSAISKYASAVRSVTEDDVKAAKRSSNIIDEIKDAVKKIPGAIQEISNVNVDAAITKLKTLITFAGDIDDADTDGLSSLSDKMEKAAKDGIDAFVKTIDSSAGDVKASGVAIVTHFKSGLTTAFPTVTTHFTVLMQTVISSISNKAPAFYGAGANLAQSFANGISDNSFRAVAKAKAMAEAAVKAAREALDINSPSKVFMALGKSIPEGFAKGIDKFSNGIDDSSISMARDAIDGTKNAIARVAELLNTDIDSQPTIRPVLDLSDVKSGASSINGLFGIQPSVDLLANVGSINTMMNGRQNVSTTNDDVVAAIKDLKHAINESSGDSYSIGDITYDDGSNIATTIQALVRASRIEGRI